MKILMMTTCILNHNSYLDLKRLVESINYYDGLSIEHVFLIQYSADTTSYDLSFIKNTNNYNVHVLYHQGVISLSSARNKMIRYSIENGVFDDVHVVTFPDDDCWYPRDFIKKLELFFTEKELNVLYFRYGTNPVVLNESLLNNDHTVKNLVSYASSNTTFYNKQLFIDIGFFDENYGVGALYNGGEDTDFAIRAFLQSSGEGFLFINSIAVGHRDPIPEFKYKYYNGSLRVLRKHSSKNLILRVIFLRKLFVGLYYLFLNKISIVDFKSKQA